VPIIVKKNWEYKGEILAFGDADQLFSLAFIPIPSLPRRLLASIWSVLYVQNIFNLDSILTRDPRERIVECSVG